MFFFFIFFFFSSGHFSICFFFLHVLINRGQLFCLLFARQQFLHMYTKSREGSFRILLIFLFAPFNFNGYFSIFIPNSSFVTSLGAFNHIYCKDIKGEKKFY